MKEDVTTPALCPSIKAVESSLCGHVPRAVAGLGAPVRWGRRLHPRQGGQLQDKAVKRTHAFHSFELYKMHIKEELRQDNQERGRVRGP